MKEGRRKGGEKERKGRIDDVRIKSTEASAVDQPISQSVS
jgi:hypothetical protein